MAIAELTLTECARRLRVPQHRLIHLCEKGVVVPDVAAASGRGSSRRFSLRNLFQFSVALALREAVIPIATIAAVVHVLRVFERTVASEIPDFSLPNGLRVPSAPDLRVVLSDGTRVFFILYGPGTQIRVFDGVDLRKIGFKQGKLSGVPRTLKRHRATGEPSEFGWPEGSRRVRSEVSISKIARDVPID